MVVEEFIMFLRFPNKCLDSLALIGGSFSTKWIAGVDEYTLTNTRSYRGQTWIFLIQNAFPKCEFFIVLFEEVGPLSWAECVLSICVTSLPSSKIILSVMSSASFHVASSWDVASHWMRSCYVGVPLFCTLRLSKTAVGFNTGRLSKKFVGSEVVVLGKLSPL